VYALLRQERKTHTRQREAVCLSLDARCWLARSGASFRGVEHVYKRFARRDALGVWEHLLAGVADDPDL